MENNIYNRSDSQEHICKFCQYKWFSKLENPKQCPLCKRYLIKKGFCEKCRKSKILVIHHRDKNHENNNINNLQTLCIDCHQHIHKVKNNYVFKINEKDKEKIKSEVKKILKKYKKLSKRQLIGKVISKLGYKNSSVEKYINILNREGFLNFKKILNLICVTLKNN